MKKKRQLTEDEKKLNRIRRVNQKIGYDKAYDELTSVFAERMSVERRQLRMEHGMPFHQHEERCRKSRLDGYETGVLVGTENARTELREFYEKQRREYEATMPPPDLSAWEQICASTRGDS